MRYYLSTGLVLLLLATNGYAQDRLVDIYDLNPRDIHMEAFALDTAQELHIEAIGGRSRDRSSIWERWFDDDNDYREEYWPGNAWILDARTREVVWELKEEDTDRERDGLRSFNGTVRLPAGVYEAYYASFAGTSYSTGNWVRTVSFSHKTYRDGDKVYWGEFVENEAFKDFRFSIEGNGQRYGNRALIKVRDAVNETAIISLTGLGDDTFEQVGFVLDEPMEIEFYALGEARRDDSFDYGWITNADTRKKIWEMDYWSSDPAGGASKNRMVHQRVELPAGRYVATFVTDDSHSADEWNSRPPYDPDFWGLTLRVSSVAHSARVRTFDYENVRDQDAFVALTRVGDHETQSEGFTLKEPMDVHVYAIGEGDDGDMYDYAWIINTSTRERVWQMRHRDTEHAGGASKNRIFDEVITLDAGSYVAYYITDGSHSYEDWNSSPPFDQEHWGLTLTPAQGALDRSIVTAYVEEEDPNILAQITQVRDHASKRTRFTLDRDTEVRIYALGEGSGGDMYDYAWIVNNDTRRAVWEMGYRMTDHAGGARKNRMVDATTVLKAGEYTVYYESDGSHSYGDWNADAPHDPMGWGVTIYQVDNR